MMKGVLGILMVSVVLIVMVAMVEAEEVLVFTDDFSTNPETNGNWDIVKGCSCAGYGTSPYSLDSNGYKLTQSNCDWTSMYLKNKITSKNWKVEYSFMASSSDFSHYLGDVMFWIYGDHRVCDVLDVNYGGYGIHTDGYINEWASTYDPPLDFSGCSEGDRDCPVIDLLKDDHGNHLDSTPVISTLTEGTWHDVKITFDDGVVNVFLDGRLTPYINYDLKADSNYNSYFARGDELGFQLVSLSGGSCSRSEDLRTYVKSFTLYCTPKTCSDYPFPKCVDGAGGLEDGCGGTLSCNIGVAHTFCNSSNYLECESGWSDCNNDLTSAFDELTSNGCEYDSLNFQTDDLNCGECNNNCISSGKSCVSGVCVENSFNYWTDMNGMPLLKSNFVVDLYDSVRLVSSANPNYNVTNGENSFVVSNRYWKAGTPGEDYNFSSDDGWSINLIDVREKVDNSPLNVEIVNPVCGSDFVVGSNKTIEIIINDSDDFVFGNVSIGGDIISINNSIDNRIKFNYTFNNAGNVGIVVKVGNDRGEKFKTTVNVMVVDTTKTDYYVAACIDEPKNFERFDSSRIFFNASSSRGIMYNVDSGLYTNFTKEDLNFSWNFQYSSGEYGIPCSGLGTGHCLDNVDEPIYAFHKNFPTVNENKAFLSVSIPD